MANKNSKTATGIILELDLLSYFQKDIECITVYYKLAMMAKDMDTLIIRFI